MSLMVDSHFPPPKSWDAFEGMIYDVFTSRLSNPALKRYGRLGQAQTGIDIVDPHINGSSIGIQCKNHPGGKITTKDIDTEITKAVGFQPAISRYIIATSASRDAQITQYVLTLSSERRALGKFDVEIHFWEDICDELVRNPQLLQIHYPELKTALSAKANEEKANELERRRNLANLVLPDVAEAQMVWAEQLASDEKPYFFEHDKDHCLRVFFKLEEIMKSALTTSVVQYDDLMTDRLKTLLRRCRTLMEIEFENLPISAWTQYRSDGALLIEETRRAFLDFIKEEETAKRRAMEEYPKRCSAVQCREKYYRHNQPWETLVDKVNNSKWVQSVYGSPVLGN